MTPEGLAQRAFERLAENERLRGSLADSGFAPLLEWAAARAVDLAPAAASLGDGGLDWLSGRLQDAVAAVVESAESGVPSDLAPLTAVIGAKAAKRVARAMARAGDPDARASAAGAALQRSVQSPAGQVR